jgi:predicted nucleic acid-binding protein
MILVDTSVLIDYLRGNENKSSRAFDHILEKGIPFGINHFIYLETLQGCRSEGDFNTLKEYLDTQVFYDLKAGRESYAEAAGMHLTLRQKGITVGSAMDCLIALTAMENDLFLLHNDADYNRIGEHFPLKIWDIQ